MAESGIVGAEGGSGGYLYSHASPRTVIHDMAFGRGVPGPGDRLPEIDLPAAEAPAFRSAELVARGQPMLLVTGSLTCPMTASSNPMLKRLHARFGERVAFVTLAVREAFPGAQYQQADAWEEKRRHARELKQRDALPWTVVVDDPSGTLHRQLDEKPNAVWLTDESGVIVYRGLWAGDEAGLEQALEAVAAGVRPRYAISNRRIGPMAEAIGQLRDIARRTGAGSEAEFWRAAPPMALLGWLADLFRPLPPKWRTASAAATLGVGLAVAATALARALAPRR